MRSIVAMSVVAAVPFVVGIACEVTKRGGAARAIERHHRAERARSEQEVVSEALQEHARVKRDEAYARVATLMGPTKAQLGPAFAGIEIGARLPAWADARVAELSRDGFSKITLHTYRGVLDRVFIELDSSHLDCALDDYVREAWGDDDDFAWNDRGQGATVTNCPSTIAFYRYYDAAAWLEHVPFGAIGKPARDVIVRLGDRVAGAEGSYWRLPHVEHGSARLDLATVNQRVVAIKIDLGLGAHRLGDALRARLGEPTHDPEDLIYAWASRSVWLRYDCEDKDCSGYTLFIGKPPDAWY